jgi:hypothetical protein
MPRQALRASLVTRGKNPQPEDQTVPIVAAGLRSAKIVKGATLKVYPGAPHGMCATLKDQINADLLAFFHSGRAQAA